MKHASLSVVMLAACGPVEPPPPPADAGVERSEVLALKSVPNPDLDLLFVVDDSGTMADKQQALAAALPAFVAELAKAEGGLPSLHLGVVSSDMGTSGSNGSPPAPNIGVIGQGGCAATGKAGALQTNGAAVTGSFLADRRLAGGGRETNYSGALADVFGQMVRLGITGCGFEQHLAAMRAAFTNEGNAGFRRASANLGIVILGDEDDCSISNPSFFGPESPALGPIDSFRCFRFGVACAPDEPNVIGSKTACAPRPNDLVEDVTPFRAFLAAEEPDPRKRMIGVLAGATSPIAVELTTPPGGGTPRPAVAASCTFTSNGTEARAFPGVRLAAMLDGLGGRTTYEPLCANDLAPAMTELAKSARRLVGDPCVEGEVADTASEPGLQADCVLVETRDSAPDAATRIPACDDTSTPGTCFRLVEDPARCTDGPGLRLELNREPGTGDADAWLSLRCVTP